MRLPVHCFTGNRCTGDRRKQADRSGPGWAPSPRLVTARALASLSELFGYVWPWAQERPELRLIFPKGAQAQVEIKAAKPAGWAYETALTPSKTEAGAQILMVTRLGKTAG